MTVQWLRVTPREFLFAQKRRHTNPGAFMESQIYADADAYVHGYARSADAVALAIARESEVRAVVLVHEGNRIPLVEGCPVFGDFGASHPIALDRYDPTDGQLVIDAAVDDCDVRALSPFVAPTGRATFSDMYLDSAFGNGDFSIFVARSRAPVGSTPSATIVYDASAGVNVSCEVYTVLRLERLATEGNPNFEPDRGEVAPVSGPHFRRLSGTLTLVAGTSGGFLNHVPVRAFDALEYRFKAGVGAAHISGSIEVIA